MTRSARTPARVSALVALMVLLALTLAATGCSTTASDTGGTSDTGTTESSTTMLPLKIGTLATEDSLPLWEAERMGYFQAEGMPKVEIVQFQSAQERDVALASGAIDAFMGDMIAAANLEASGKKVGIVTVMLGTEPTQGRFGIVAAPKSGVKSLKDLANVPIGTSTATIQEYVLDGLMAEAGVPADQVKTEEVKKVPVRYELLMAGKLKAAALPEPFLSLAEQGGAKILGDDTKAKSNLSQTVLVFSDDFLAKKAGRMSKQGLITVWNIAVNDINRAPEAYRDLLIEKVGLPKPLKDAYQMQVYPSAQPPAQSEVEAVLKWMQAKGYLKAPVTYGDLKGE